MLEVGDNVGTNIGIFLVASFLTCLALISNSCNRVDEENRTRRCESALSSQASDEAVRVICGLGRNN